MEKKIFDADKMDFVPAPLPANETKDEKTDAEKQGADKLAAEAKAKEEEAKVKAAAEGKKDEVDSKEKAKKDPDEEEEDVVDEETFIKDRYAEKYKINSSEDLDERLELVEAMGEKIKKLEAEAGKPKFETEEDEKIFNFVKAIGYDSTKLPDALQTYARVISMDVEKADPRILLEEQFILKNPEFTREEAQRKFKKDFDKKYGPLDPKAFEGDANPEEALKEAEEDRRIDLKGAKAKAAKFLAEKQKEFKANPIKNEEKEQPENELITKAIAKSAKEFGTHLGKFKELVFSPSDNEDDDFPIKFDEKQIGRIRAVVDRWVKNPDSYDEKGKLLFGEKEEDATPEEMTKRAAYMMFGDEIFEKMHEHVKTITAAARIEDLGKVNPDRKPKLGGSPKATLSEEEQWDKSIEARTKKNGQRKPAMA